MEILWEKNGEIPSRAERAKTSSAFRESRVKEAVDASRQNRVDRVLSDQQGWYREITLVPSVGESFLLRG